MGKPHFPLFADISKKKICVVGGGKIAARRVDTLLKFADDITVIAPEMTRSLAELEREGEIRCLHREYQRGDIEYADMVLAATDKRELNWEIEKECRLLRKKGKRILFNTADDRNICDFYFPAVAIEEEIVIGINSGGRNPGKVKKVRQMLAGILRELHNS